MTTSDAPVRNRPDELTVPHLAWRELLVVIVIAAAACVFGASRYHLFADEIYFIVAGRDHLSIGYADQGPLLPLLSAGANAVAGGSLIAFRALAILVTLAATGVTALIAREMGGGRWAQVVAAAAFATSPLLLDQSHTMATNTFDTSLWVVITWLAARWIRTHQDRLLVWAGVVTAVDLQVKWLVPVLWVGIGVGALWLGPRELLRRPALWVGAAIAIFAAIPGLWWQAAHGWPQLGLGAAVAGEQQDGGGRLMFVPIVLLYLGVLGIPLTALGIWQMLQSPRLRPYRLFAVAFGVGLVVFLAADGRPYYPSGLFAVLFAAGAVALTQIEGRGIRPVVAAVALTIGSVAMVATTLPWAPASHIAKATSTEEAASKITVYGELGWRGLTRDVEAAAQHQAQIDPAHPPTVVIAGSYWQAAVLDYYGTGLPPVYSPDRGYGYFGTPPDSARSVLVVDDTTTPPQYCSHRHVVTTISGRLAYPGGGTDVSIWQCIVTGTWSQIWPGLRHM